MPPPLALDVDGTMTRAGEGPRHRGLDPRVFETLPAWDAPVVVATGKSFPYPVALCGFLGVPERVVAENGGVVYADDEVRYLGDPEGAEAVVEQYRAEGYDVGWGEEGTVNRWRETEKAVSRDSPVEPLRRIADEHGLKVLDTGYAYHVLDPDVSKGEGLRAVCGILGLDPDAFVAVGDSENDVALFEAAGRSFAVGDADERAKAAADAVTDAAAADGLLEAIEQVREA